MESHLIITIGRQIGAGGLGAARLLAQEFGMKVYDKELLAEVARESGLDEACFEKRDEKSSRGVLGALQGFRSLFGVYNRAGTDSVMNEDRLFQIQSEVMRDIAAKEDCIIVGRCADYILRHEPRLVTVFISASLDSRVKRIMEGEKLSEEDARRYVEQGDRKRAEYYNYYTFKKWGDSASYDLCIDSSKLNDDIGAVVDLIKYYMKQRHLI
ncbi:MAG: cytidylate kinase-like family protein [Bacteroidales bacterium]|nr:cytidylate kinase-like family protein [Bacteroidales bacterium]